MILCRNERRGFTPRRKVAKVRKNQEEAVAKNLKPPRVVPLRLCFLAELGRRGKIEIRAILSPPIA